MADEAATALPGQVDDGELQHLKSYSDVGQHLRQKTQDGSTLPTVASADGHFGADKGSLEEVVESGFANGSSLSDAGVTVDGLLAQLASDRDNGISGTDLEKRREAFGVNYIEPPPMTSLLELMWEAVQDPTLILLLIAAFVNLILGYFFHAEHAAEPWWLEGVAISGTVVRRTLLSCRVCCAAERSPAEPARCVGRSSWW